jgi:hypothetical protein
MHQAISKNAVMRLITGCHKISGQNHLLAKCSFLPVAKHLEHICSQFLASSYCEEHPSHRVIKQPTGTHPGRKGIVHTLQSRFNLVVEPFLSDFSPPRYKKVINDIHTSVVSECKRGLRNRVTGRVPDKINPSECSLPQITRCILSQLTDDNSNCLKMYQATIGTSPDDLCPVCRGTSHTTAHLFSCPLSKTDL